MKYKKICAALLCVSLLFGMAGCEMKEVQEFQEAVDKAENAYNNLTAEAEKDIAAAEEKEKELLEENETPDEAPAEERAEEPVEEQVEEVVGESVEEPAEEPVEQPVEEQIVEAVEEPEEETSEEEAVEEQQAPEESSEVESPETETTEAETTEAETTEAETIEAENPEDEISEELTEAPSLLAVEVKDRVIKSFDQENRLYLFLPSGIADRNGSLPEGALICSQISDAEGSTLKFQEETYKVDDALPEIQLGRDYPIWITSKETLEENQYILKVMASENLSSIWIETESGTTSAIHADKDVKEAGSMVMLNEKGEVVMASELDHIKCRGNSTFREYDKKSYQIKLNEKYSFFGMGEASKWILSANASDDTLLRNAVSLQLAEKLSLKTPGEGDFVDLYLNGAYAGNYYMSEKIEVGENRLEIEDLEADTKIANAGKKAADAEDVWGENWRAKDLKNPEDITGGYLIERDFADRFLTEIDTMPSYFRTEAEEWFEVHAPEYPSEQELLYIRDFVQSCENAILSGEGIDGATGKYYTELIDLDSFVAKYLLEEVTGNFDGGLASSYFYKDKDEVSPLLHAGPAWDYDITWGNTPPFLGKVSSSANRLTRLHESDNATPWFNALYEKKEFQTAMTKTYRKVVQPWLKAMVNGGLEKLAETTDASARMDRVRWAAMHEPYYYYASRDAAVKAVLYYMEKRLEFLDSAWIDGVTYHRVRLYVDGALYETLYVKDNEAMGVLPPAYVDDKSFNGWILMRNGLPVDPDRPVLEDIEIKATFLEEAQ